MTLEVYINGARSYTIANWTPTQGGQSISDGRQIGGEWLETWVYADDYRSDAVGWDCFYRFECRIPSTLRLDSTNTSISFTENPGGFPQPSQPTFLYKGTSAGIGPTTINSTRVQWTNPHDEQHYAGNQNESWRLVLRLYFTRITHAILRDQSNNNIIMRSSVGPILADA